MDGFLTPLPCAGDPCDLQHPWYGIYGENGLFCGENVQEIALTGNNLQGTLPEIFDQFDNLQRVAFDSLLRPTLARNYLKGTIPATLFQKSLLHLDLYHNLLNGKIPVELVLASSLVELNLGSNVLVIVLYFFQLLASLLSRFSWL